MKNNKNEKFWKTRKFADGLFGWWLRALIIIGLCYIPVMFLLMPFLVFIKIGKWHFLTLDAHIYMLKFWVVLGMVWGILNWVIGKFIKMPEIKRKESAKRTVEDSKKSEEVVEDDVIGDQWNR